MILENAFTNSIGNAMGKLGRLYRGLKWEVKEFVSQAPFKMIFSSSLLRRVFKVRRTSLRSIDMMCSLTEDGALYRLRWLGFVNVCVDYDGSFFGFCLNRGRSVSEVKKHFYRAISSSY